MGVFLVFAGFWTCFGKNLKKSESVSSIGLMKACHPVVVETFQSD